MIERIGHEYRFVNRWTKTSCSKKTGDLFESLDLVKETISDISSDLDNEGTEALKSRYFEKKENYK